MLTLRICRPLAYQVIQRRGFDRTNAHVHGETSALGHASFDVELDSPPPAKTTLEYRVVRSGSGDASDIAWLPLRGAFAEAPAGGWYRLEIRAVADGAVHASGAVEPFGVGEIFLIAGQSYADNCNDEQLRVADPEGRVVSFDPIAGRWQIAHDPQLTPSKYRDGSIWPAVGEALLPLVRVPIGFVNVAYGGTASAAWMPGESNFANLVNAGKAVGAFRYLLWQQGESDVINDTPTETYVKNLATIRDSFVNECGCDAPWLLAKSTFHPTVYNKPAAEQAIRAAIDELWTKDGFAPGPDTDILGGDLRGEMQSKRHFSPKGQRIAASMWCAAILNQLSNPSVNRPK